MNSSLNCERFSVAFSSEWWESSNREGFCKSDLHVLDSWGLSIYEVLDWRECKFSKTCRGRRCVLSKKVEDLTRDETASHSVKLDKDLGDCELCLADHPSWLEVVELGRSEGRSERFEGRDSREEYRFSSDESQSVCFRSHLHLRPKRSKWP